MFAILRKMFVAQPPEAVDGTYIALVAAARNPFFITQYHVPDSLDGRFGLIVVHLFLLQHRLMQADPAQIEAAQVFARHLSEAFFQDMDNCLRELGVADTGVSHRIKKMGKAYHGSLQAYSAGLEDRALLLSALARNLYGTIAEGNITDLEGMAHYITLMHHALAATPIDTILAGNYRWPQE